MHFMQGNKKQSQNKKTVSKLTTCDEQKYGLFKKMIDNDYDAIRLLDTDNMDLNIFENVEELSFIDEKVSPLVYCSCIGRTQIAKLLLRNQYIDVDLETPTNKQTPLIAACGGANYEMAKLLLDAGAEVNKPNNFNQTPLVMTVFRLLEEYNSFEIRRICTRTMELLVHKGADVNWIIDKQEGYTLLHSLCSCTIKMSKAERQINYEIIKFLIDSGADINMKAFNGKRPEDLVTGHCSMTAILDLIIKRKDILENKGDNKQNRPQNLIPKKKNQRIMRQMFSDLCESNPTSSCQSGSASVSRSKIKKFEESEKFTQQFLSVNALKKK